jgi:hypothetical protein
MATNEENAKLQSKIISEWVAFSRTDAYKDWVQSMEETMQMYQDNVDNMTEPRPSIVPGVRNLAPIDAEKAALINQRKVGIKYALQYPALRIESSES